MTQSNPYGKKELNQCKMDPSRATVTGIIIELCRVLFSPEGINLAHEDLRKYYWKEEMDSDMDKAKYQVYIDSVYSWKPELANIRPAILIKANSWAEQKMGLGDLVGTGNQDSVIYEKLITGSHTIFVIGKNEAQTELLSREVHLWLTQFSQPVREALGFHRWEISQLAELSELEESEEHFVTPVVIGYQLAHKWELKPVARLLQHALIKVTASNSGV